MTDNNTEQRFRLVKKPPESGWSYLIAIGLGLAVVSIINLFEADSKLIQN